VVVFAGNVVARALGFLFPVLIARMLDRPDFAIASFLISTGFFAGELVLTGFPTAMTRALAAARDPADRAPWTIAALVAGLPLLFASLVLGGVLATRADAPVGLLAVVIVGLTIDAYYFALLRGLRRFGWLAIYRVAANLAQLVIIVVLAVVAPSLLTLTSVVVVYSLVYLAPIAVIEIIDGPARRTLRSSAVTGARSLERWRMIDLTKFAIPALLSGTAYGAILGFDVFFVRVFAPASLADYAAARSLALPMMLVPFALAVVLLPQVAAASDRDVGRLLGRALAIAIVAAIGGWLAFLLVGPLVIEFLFPPSYRAAIEPLTTLVPAVGLLGVYSIMSGWMMGIGRPWTSAVCLGVGALVTIAGQIVITSRLGAVGAGIAMSLGVLTALALIAVATIRILRSARLPHLVTDATTAIEMGEEG
jgi:O-antigen/teichoic acid export membrane protein